MRLNRLLPLLALLAAPALLHAAAARGPVAPAAPADPNAPISRLILRDAPVDMVLDQLAELTGRIILRPQSLQVGFITINITKPVAKDEAIRAIESILQLNGIAVLYMGDKFIKVVNNPNSIREGFETLTVPALSLPPSNKIASKIFELKFLTPQNVVAQVQQMLTQGSGQALAFTNSPFFQVTDTIANLQRIETLVNSLDHPFTGGDAKPRFMTLKYASASDLAQRVQALVQSGNSPISQAVSGASLSFDQRTNQLIVIGTEEQFNFFKGIVDQIDIVANPTTKTRTFPLSTASASSVETMLRTLIQSTQQATNTTAQNPNRQGGAAGRQGGANNQGNANQGTNARGAAAGGTTAAAGGAAGAAGAGGAVAAAGAPGLNVVGTGSGSVGDFSSSLAFTSDTRSNTIVVNGTESDLNILGDIIKSVDKPLPQVRVEVVIADVSLSDEFDTGIGALGLELKNDKLVGINGNAGGISLTGSGAISSTSTTFGMLGLVTSALSHKGLTGVVNIADTPRKGIANIISAPTIRTQHNTPGGLFVGEQRPFASGSVTAGGTGGTTTTITQINIGVSLTVSPLIGADGTVQMQIQQSISDHAGDVTIDGNPQPVISSRTMSATISCKSGDIIVLGGLRRSANSKSTSALAGIPFLGDIFGSRQTIKTTNDLVFFVRPVVSDARTEDQSPDIEKKINELDKDNQKTVRDLLGMQPPPKPDSKSSSPPASTAVPPGSTTFPSAPSTTTRPNSRGGR